jgi:hypothetical protein
VAREFNVTTSMFIKRVRDLGLSWTVQMHMDPISSQQYEELKARWNQDRSSTSATGTRPPSGSSSPTASTDSLRLRTQPTSAEVAPASGKPLYAIAAELGMTDVELARRIKQLGLDIDTRNHMAPVPVDRVAALMSALGSTPPPPKPNPRTTLSR